MSASSAASRATGRSAPHPPSSFCLAAGMLDKEKTGPASVLKALPGAQVHFIWANGQGALLAGVEKTRPSYERLLQLLRSVPGSKASRSWVDRVNPFNRVCHL